MWWELSTVTSGCPCSNGARDKTLCFQSRDGQRCLPDECVSTKSLVDHTETRSICLLGGKQRSQELGYKKIGLWGDPVVWLWWVLCRANFLDWMLNAKRPWKELEGRSPVTIVLCSPVTKYCSDAYIQQCCITSTILTFTNMCNLITEMGIIFLMLYFSVQYKCIPQFPVLGSHDLLDMKNCTLYLTGWLVGFPSDLYNIHIITHLSGNTSDFISHTTENAILGWNSRLILFPKTKAK